MEPTQELIDAIFRDKILRAREKSAAEKLSAAVELFDEVEQWAIAGIRMQHPHADDGRVREILRQRRERVRNLSESSR